jgi:hypothetical protein
MSNEEVKDRILDAFKGNKTIHILELKNNKSIHDNYYVIENNLNYLIGADLIRCDGDNLYLSPMGFYMISDLPKVGFVAKENEKNSSDGWEFVKRTAIIIGAISSIVTLTLLIKQCSRTTEKDKPISCQYHQSVSTK